MRQESRAKGSSIQGLLDFIKAETGYPVVHAWLHGPDDGSHSYHQPMGLISPYYLRRYKMINFTFNRPVRSTEAAATNFNLYATAKAVAVELEDRLEISAGEALTRAGSLVYGLHHGRVNPALLSFVEGGVLASVSIKSHKVLAGTTNGFLTELGIMPVRDRLHRKAPQGALMYYHEHSGRHVVPNHPLGWEWMLAIEALALTRPRVSGAEMVSRKDTWKEWDPAKDPNRKVKAEHILGWYRHHDRPNVVFYLS